MLPPARLLARLESRLGLLTTGASYSEGWRHSGVDLRSREQRR
jgi:hypothetical protein